MKTLEEQSRLVSERIDMQKYGFDPMTILTVITTVLPLLMSCFNRNDEQNNEAVQATFKRYHEHNPVSLRNRTMRRVRAESDENLTKSQAYAIADAVIEQALATDSATASLCAEEAGV